MLLPREAHWIWFFGGIGRYLLGSPSDFIFGPYLLKSTGQLKTLNTVEGGVVFG